MDLRATEVTRWVDADLSGLAFGNEYHCFVVQRAIRHSPEQDYFISTETSRLASTGGILEMTVSGHLLTLRLSAQAAQSLGLDTEVLIDLSDAGSDREGAIDELSAMIGREGLADEGGQLALFD